MARRQILENRAVQQMNENLPNTPARLGKRKSVKKPAKDRAFHPSPRSAALLSNAQAVVQAAIIRKKLDLGYKTNLKLGLSPRRPKPAETTILGARATKPTRSFDWLVLQTRYLALSEN